MCGITGYIGKNDSVPILLKGLKRLEYRGYDSAGLALLYNKRLVQLKQSGKVAGLESLVDDSPYEGNCGIAHTRWATHGEPSDINAHPHLDHTGKIALVHNGIIEKLKNLKKMKTVYHRGLCYFSPKIESIDIDTLEDFKLCQKILKK